MTGACYLASMPNQRRYEIDHMARTVQIHAVRPGHIGEAFDVYHRDSKVSTATFDVKSHDTTVAVPRGARIVSVDDDDMRIIFT